MQRHGKVTGMKSDDFIANGDCGRLRAPFGHTDGR